MKKISIIKQEIENLKVQTRRKEKKSKERADIRWIIIIMILAFSISFVFSFASELILPNVNVVIGTIILIAFIFIGVLFDMIGVAVTTADEKTFHSMNARKVKGADKVSSFCNDVIGDICGIISGSAGAIIALSISNTLKTDLFITTLIVTAFIASLTIGGKAIGKSYAINKSDIILYRFAKFISNFYHIKK